MNTTTMSSQMKSGNNIMGVATWFIAWLKIQSRITLGSKAKVRKSSPWAAQRGRVPRPRSYESRTYDIHWTAKATRFWDSWKDTQKTTREIMNIKSTPAKRGFQTDNSRSYHCNLNAFREQQVKGKINQEVKRKEILWKSLHLDIDMDVVLVSP